MAKGERFKATTIGERLHKYLAPSLLSAIREHETLDSSELRAILESEVPLQIRKKVGGHMGRYLVPKVSKQAVDFIIQFLDMGTWTVVGDIERVYRVPNCEYKGWQRNSVTTPDILFSVLEQPSENPFWAKPLDDGTEKATPANCTPEESMAHIIESVRKFFPDAPKALEKLIRGF